MISIIASGLFPARSGTSRSSLAARARRDNSLLERYGAWLQRLSDAATVREIEPHRARDIGLSVCTDRCPDSFTVDPRPLWGIALTPHPTEESPPWIPRCQG
jgi:hypothetical protein